MSSSNKGMENGEGIRLRNIQTVQEKNEKLEFVQKESKSFPIPSSDETVRDLISHYMKNFSSSRDGVLDMNDIYHMHNILLSRDQEIHILKKRSLFLVVFLLISFGLNFVMSIVAVKLLKSTTVAHDYLVNFKDNNHIVSTSDATKNIPLALLPLAGHHIVDNVKHVSFLALHVNFIKNSISPGFVEKVKFGMDVSSYFYFNETSVLLLGPRQENLLIDSGTVLVWGLPGMAVGDVSRVCPGINDPSHARCFVVTTTDIDLTKLSARAAQIKTSTLASSFISSSVSMFTSCSPII
eukprot:gene2603-5093_t